MHLNKSFVNCWIPINHYDWARQRTEAMKSNVSRGSLPFLGTIFSPNGSIRRSNQRLVHLVIVTISRLTKNSTPNKIKRRPNTKCNFSKIFNRKRFEISRSKLNLLLVFLLEFFFVVKFHFLSILFTCKIIYFVSMTPLTHFEKNTFWLTLFCTF